MYKRILIATDGSELAMKAVKQALELAKCVGATVTAVAVTYPWSASPLKNYESIAAQEAGRRLAAVADLASELGVACNTVHVADRYPAEGIEEVAKTRNCDLIVMASHGRRGISEVMLGSEAARVLANSATPVLICK
jgi:nucleotide-binding universal stress UspA family protein